MTSYSFYKRGSFRMFILHSRLLIVFTWRHGGHICVQNNESAALFVYRKDPVRVELFSQVKTLFYSKQFANLLTTWLKTIYIYIFTFYISTESFFDWFHRFVNTVKLEWLFGCIVALVLTITPIKFLCLLLGKS